MSFHINQYPDFELFEVQPELLLSFKQYYPLTPLGIGAHVQQLVFTNGLNTWKQFFNGAQTHNHFAVGQLLNKPLVIAFYSYYWQQAGFDFVKKLNAINSEIRAAGGSLIIVSDYNSDELQKIVSDNRLSLNFYFDADNILAQRFGVYHNDSPVWERFSGINADVPLLATYVVDASHRVLFSYTNWDEEEVFDTDKLLDEIYRAGKHLNTRKSA